MNSNSNNSKKSISSWLETGWLGYHAVASTLLGLANITLPMAVLNAGVSNRGGGSLQKLFETTLEAVETAQKTDISQSVSNPPPAAPTSPYSSAVGALTDPSQNAQIASALASDRVATAHENLDTLAALVASSLFQIQYALGLDVLTTYLCVHALRPSTPVGEIRLVHKCLGIVKACQYFVYFLHESVTQDGLALGPGTFVNLAGVGTSLAASYYWGWKREERK